MRVSPLPRETGTAGTADATGGEPAGIALASSIGRRGGSGGEAGIGGGAARLGSKTPTGRTGKGFGFPIVSVRTTLGLIQKEMTFVYA